MNTKLGVIYFSSKEDEEEYRRYERKKILDLYEGETLKEIDDNAVFYGFTQIPSNGIIKMDSSDMMVEHGKGHLEIKINHCRFRSSEDLAYWTRPDYWNEVSLKRKETDIDKANELREQNGIDRILPSCIVCFDGKINQKSLFAAKIHNIPILMIDRQRYLDLNMERLQIARQEFSNTLSQDAINEIFYRLPYYKIVEEMPFMIDKIREHREISTDNKKSSLEYLAYLCQYFIEQSSGYICDVPVEEYNKKMQEYIQIIDMELQEYDDLITMKDMEGAYKETSARDRRKRYEQFKKDILSVKSKEGKIIHE